MNNTLLSILAGLGGMFGWGTSDFLANIATEKIGHHKTFFYSQIAGLLLIISIVLFKAAACNKKNSVRMNKKETVRNELKKLLIPVKNLRNER